MTKSKNTKDEQQKDLCITSEQLTEKWKKGELPDGWYYTEIDLYENGDFIEIIPNVYNDCFEYGIIKQVLAPVPSYEEYQKLLSDQLAKNEGVEINAELEAENTKLKTENKWYSEQLHAWVDRAGDLEDLLKECKQWFDWYHIDTGTGKEYIESWHKKGHAIHQRIDQVLGE